MTIKIRIPTKINDICPSCNPTSYIKSTCTFIEQEQEDEYLYQCDKCNAKLWVDIDWAKRNEVKAND